MTKMQKEKLNLVGFILVAMGLFLLTSPATCSPQQEPVSQMEKANKVLEEGKYQEAIKIYLSILQDNPRNFAVRARLAWSFYLAANENADYFYRAAKEYKKIIREMPDFSLPYLELGQIAYLLALTSEAEGKQKHAQDLYKSALDWFSKYIELEKKGKTFDSQREVPVTKVLQAAIYSRIGKKDKTYQLINEAKKEYKVLSSQKEDLTPLYDYFVRSGVEYLNTELYNQALIYLEGAWLIEPRPQIKTLLENVIKAKGVSISLIQPVQRGKEKEVSPETTEKRIERLDSRIENVSKKLEVLSSLEEKLEGLKGQVRELVQLKVEIEKLKAKMDKLSQTPPPIKNQPQLQEYFEQLSQLRERINTLSKKTESLSQLQNKIQDLEGKIDKLDKKIKSIKSVADKFSILKIQLQELKKIVEQLQRKITQKETGVQKEKVGE